MFPSRRRQGARKWTSISSSPNERQPRIAMDDAKLEELARSIRVNGIIQPILVRRRATLSNHRRRTAVARGSARRVAQGPRGDP